MKKKRVQKEQVWQTKIAVVTEKHGYSKHKMMEVK